MLTCPSLTLVLLSCFNIRIPHEAIPYFSSINGRGGDVPPDSDMLVQMRMRRPNTQWCCLLSLVIGEINEHFFNYIVITNIEDEWAWRNVSVTWRLWQGHYFHCNCTSPSGGGSSLVHGSTTRRYSISSRIRRQWRRYLFSFLTKGGCVIAPFNQYLKLHILQEVGRLAFTTQQRSGHPYLSPYPSQNIIVRWVYILYVS